MTDSKQGKMAVPPFHFFEFDQPIFDEQGKSTFNMQTLKAQFAAPPQAGHYTFVMHLVCDSYVGFDTKMEVTLVVEEASKAAAMAAEDEISEPDEGKSFLAPFESYTSLTCHRLPRRPDERTQGRQRPRRNQAAEEGRGVG